MYSDAEILSMLKDCDFSEVTQDNWFGRLKREINLKPKMEKGIWYENGASKIVIGWSRQNWVIKIPFTGRYEYDEDRGCSQCVLSRCEYGSQCIKNNEVYAGTDSEFEWFTGANNSDNDWDYCLKELELYDAACEAGVEAGFARVRFVGLTENGHPIYMQEKIDSEGYDQSPYKVPSKEEIATAKSFRSSTGASLNWVAILAVLKVHGEEFLLKMIKFIDDYYISDLHDGNVGFKKNRFMFIDYSGFNEGW